MADNKGMIPHQEFMKDDYFAKWYPKWISNAMENHPVIKRDFEKKDCCITAMPRPMNRPCMILGGGVSLDDALPKLKNWKNPIFSSSSLTAALVKHERQPDYICAFDSLHVTWEEHLKGLILDKSILLTHPTIEPELLKGWKWDKRYYRRVFPQHEFFELTFPLMYPFIRIGFVFTGSVINNAVGIASFLGYNPIYLVGVDYGWKDPARTRCKVWRSENGTIVRDPTPKEGPNESVIEIDGVRTASNHYSFKEGMLGVMAQELGRITFVDVSDGLVTELPKDNLDNVIEKQGFIDYDVPIEVTKEKFINFFMNRGEIMARFNDLAKLRGAANE